MASFFEYFKSLGMPYIKKEGGVNEGIARAAGDQMDDAKEDIKWVRRQFIPALCEDELVTAHAKARGIERYEYESDEFFRNRIQNAYQFFESGGRVAGMNEFLAAIGIKGGVLEYHEYSGEPAIGWAEFAAVVDMETVNQDPESRVFLTDLFNELKPARSKLALFVFTLDTTFTSQPIVTLGVTDYTAFIECHGIAARSFDIIGWGCETLDGVGTLDGHWGELTITDL